MAGAAGISEPGAGIGYQPRPAWLKRLMAGHVGPVLVVCLAIVAIWYFGAIALNAPFARETLERAGEPYTAAEFVVETLGQQRPVLPSPHQVAAEVWKTIFGVAPTSKRSLVYHGWVTLSS